jgi:hypothetical protein
MTTPLTTKEQALLDAIKEGMDAPGSGWLHELNPFNANDHICAGVLGALIEKGLVCSHEERTPGYPPAYWVELT